VDVRNRNNAADTQLGFAELGSIGLQVGGAAEAIADLGLSLQLNSDLVPGATTVFPKIVGDFFFQWSIGNRAAGSLVPLSGIDNAIQSGLKLVAFRDVGLDLGTFISDFLGPIIGQVQDVTEPIQPLIDVLTAPIPVISDLAGSPITLIDIAGHGRGQPGSDSPSPISSRCQQHPTPRRSTLIIPFGDFVVPMRPARRQTCSVGRQLTDRHRSAGYLRLRFRYRPERSDTGGDPRPRPRSSSATASRTRVSATFSRSRPSPIRARSSGCCWATTRP
jgi:hypothetical protein